MSPWLLHGCTTAIAASSSAALCKHSAKGPLDRDPRARVGRAGRPRTSVIRALRNRHVAHPGVRFGFLIMIFGTLARCWPLRPAPSGEPDAVRSVPRSPASGPSGGPRLRCPPSCSGWCPCVPLLLSSSVSYRRPSVETTEKGGRQVDARPLAMPVDCRSAMSPEVPVGVGSRGRLSNGITVANYPEPATGRGMTHDR